MAKTFVEIKEIKDQLNKDIKEKFDEIEAEKAKFIEAASSFCIDWTRSYAEKKAFEDNFQITEKLGLKLLKEFKHEVDHFCKKVPELARKEFSKKSYWQHYEILDANTSVHDKLKASHHLYSTLSYLQARKDQQILDLGIRLVIGNFGLILKKYEYLNPEKNSNDQWEQKPGIFCYPFPLFPLSWPKDMCDIMESYIGKLEQFQELNSKLSQTIEEEKKQNIKIDWH